jgi:hypothetical protein
MSSVAKTATPAQTAAGDLNWDMGVTQADKVVRHEAKLVDPTDPSKGNIYEEFYSADFGPAGRWMTTNLTAWTYDSDVYRCYPALNTQCATKCHRYSLVFVQTGGICLATMNGIIWRRKFMKMQANTVIIVRRISPISLTAAYGTLHGMRPPVHVDTFKGATGQALIMTLTGFTTAIFKGISKVLIEVTRTRVIACILSGV